jgi:hypothetical protein
MSVKVYELVLDTEDDEVFAISLVDAPAIESNFQYFSKDYKIEKFKTFDVEKQMVIGPVMIPNILIDRVDENGERYQVFFSKDTIEKIAHQYIKKGYVNEITEDHNFPIKNVSVVESWVISDSRKDKSNLYGYNLPVGSWVSIIKIEDKDYFQNFVKTGKLKGFSVEGHFTQRLKKFSAIQFDKYAEIDFVPPKSVSESAETALKWRDKGCSGGTTVGFMRANQLMKRQKLSPQTIKRMVSFFARHSKNRADGTDLTNGCPTPGYLAWMLWGGDAGEVWANKVNEQMKRIDEKFKKEKKQKQQNMKKNELVDFFKKLGFSYKEDESVEKNDEKMEVEEGMVLVDLDTFMASTTEKTEMTVEIDGVMFKITVEPVVTAEGDASETGEAVQNPALEVVEELKKELEAVKAEFSAFKSQKVKPVMMKREVEGTSKSKSGVNVSEVMSKIRENKK